MTTNNRESGAGHTAVLQQETLQALQIDPAGIYLDGTFGRGGHSRLILDQLDSKGQLIAFDQDPEAVAYGRQHFLSDTRFCLYHKNFEQLEATIEEIGLSGRVRGVLLDLGVSSPQLDTPERGFSFAKDGQLDMRMDPSQGQSAGQWLAGVDEDSLARVLRDYGEERYARRIARAIVAAREARPIMTTLQLADIIRQAHPRWERHHHPATRSFQAIRIFVNRELAVLESALTQALSVLQIGGRLVVISFHSLEDRQVKRFFKGTGQQYDIPRHLPPPPDQPAGPALRALGRRRAGERELAENPRARSAVLRWAERIR